MRVFFLQADSDNYQALFPRNEADIDVVEKLKGYPISSVWSPINVEVLVDYPEDASLPQGDFPSMTTSALPVFSQKAVDALKELLLPNGELLPLNVDNGSYYIFNVTTVVDALDLPKCDIVYFDDGRILDIRQYTFHSDMLKNLKIFKVPQLLSNPIFVTDEFVKNIQENKLDGFKFKQAWEST